ncbi:MAG: TonB-dependent receptor [Flavobacteriales bacterium]
MNLRFFIYRLFLIVSLFSIQKGLAQTNIHVIGHLSDLETKEEVIGAHIFIDSVQSVISNASGNFVADLPKGKHRFIVSFIGYQTLDTVVSVSENNKNLHFKMRESNNLLDVLVVSDSRYSHKYEESAIAIDVISPDELKLKSPSNIQKTIEQLPSVHMIGDQINIRGGSGWTYGAGSRVLLLQDGVPMMEGAEAGIQWYSIEPESTQQIEMVKGSSSVLYGASALNGTINVQTRKPTKKPYTSISILHGAYDSPKRANSNHNEELEDQYVDDLNGGFDTITVATNGRKLNDWNNKSFPLTFSNYTVYHEQKLGKVELSGSYNYFREQHYIQNNKENKRHRIFGKVAHDLRKTHGLYYGISASFIDNLRGESFLFNGDQDPYRSYDYVTYDLHSKETAIRPFLEIGREDSKWNHRFNGQYYKVAYQDTVTNYSTLYYGNYQSQFKLDPFVVTFGGNGSYVKGETTSANIDAHQFNLGAYAQLEYKYKKLAATAGARYEYNNENNNIDKAPIYRLATNYKLSNRTFLKASYGEAIRFPSLLEKFFQRNAGEITFLPNPDLEPEKGWTGEVGILHKFKTGNWKFSAEANAFIMKFDNMTELSFGVWGGDVNKDLNPLGIGFKAVNVGETRVSGIELNTRGYGQIGQVEVDFKLGYTYMNPIALDNDYVYASYKDEKDSIAAGISDDPLVQAFVGFLIDSIGDVTYNNTSSDPSVLKYRFQHLVNLDLAFHYKKFHPSVNIRYNSYMKNVDQLFESSIFNAGVRDIYYSVSNIDGPGGVDLAVQDMGIKNSRQRNKNGDWFFDLRLGYDLADNIKVMFAVENVFNHEAQIRPAQVSAPRKFSLQTNITF